MALSGYGLLIGSVVATRPPRAKSPHFLLFVQPKTEGHPPYRVAVNVGSGLEYQVLDLQAHGKALADKLRALGPSESFIVAADHHGLPTLDFVHGGLIDPEAFRQMSQDGHEFRDAFVRALAKAAKKENVLVAVWGTGSPLDRATGEAPTTGFTGVKNVHMNQGTRHAVGGTHHFHENGAGQDGGLVLFDDESATAFFCKFATQTIATDPHGRATDTGVEKIDKTPISVRKTIQDAYNGARPTARVPSAPANEFVFADPNQSDANEQFAEDDDKEHRSAPYVVKQQRGSTRGPVPSPRGGTYPIVTLTNVVPKPSGYAKTAAGETIVFDLVGDSGAPTAEKIPGEESVTALMTKLAKDAPPAFLFHLGDVVYYYGEKDYYYSQFYEPFQYYPAPIFAIPGNHDGMTYEDDMVSLAPFMSAFCAEKTARWAGSGGILRTAMTQPSVFFTLDAPLVSIVGLYSGVGESGGWLDQQQTDFLFQELTRLKDLRAKEGRAIILAIHHCPHWFPDLVKKDPTSAAIDAACEKAGIYPDAVVCGHAHLYQRIVREVGGKEIPYLIAGAGGYGIVATQVSGKSYIQKVDPRMHALVLQEGFLRATVTKPAKGNGTLRFDYHSVKSPDDTPADGWVVPLT